jgi:indole-3-glycerol phosphate synthase
MTELPDILRQIVDQRRLRIEERRRNGGGATPGPVSSKVQPNSRKDFLARLATPLHGAIIAEVKMGSPRLGSLVGKVDPEDQARLYASSGAAALSVVVEPDFFHGSHELLARCRRASGLPTLAKDFVVDPLQLTWSAEAGADAVLLIAAIVSDSELLELAGRARELGLVPLIECHSRSDVDKLAGHAWELVGINNRDLRSFEVDLDHSAALLDRLPRDACKVAESGIATRADIDRLTAAGFDAFLVGESLLTAADPAAKLRELTGMGSRSE